MLIEKIAEIYARSDYQSNNQRIAQKIFELQDQIDEYSLKEFIGEAKVSKSSVQRFLQEIGAKEFKTFKRGLYLEFFRFHNRLNHHPIQMQDEVIAEINRQIKKADRVFVIGDTSIINIFKLYLPYILIKKYPIYIINHLNVNHDLDAVYHFSENDYIIHGSLTSSYETLKENSELYDMFVLNKNTFKAKIIFIGEIHPVSPVAADFMIPLKRSASITQKIKYICSVFESTLF